MTTSETPLVDRLNLSADPLCVEAAIFIDSLVDVLHRKQAQVLDLEVALSMATQHLAARRQHIEHFADQVNGLIDQAAETLRVTRSMKIRMPDGTTFTCWCGCQMMHKIEQLAPGVARYVCNACGAAYEGEK